MSALTRAWAKLAKMDLEIHQLAAELAEAPETIVGDATELARVGAAVKLARRYFSEREVAAGRSAREARTP